MRKPTRPAPPKAGLTTTVTPNKIGKTAYTIPKVKQRDGTEAADKNVCTVTSTAQAETTYIMPKVIQRNGTELALQGNRAHGLVDKLEAKSKFNLLDYFLINYSETKRMEWLNLPWAPSLDIPIS